MNVRVKIRITAISLLLLYTVVRTVLVQATLSSYGVNVWYFLLIDATSGVVYVLSLEQLIMTLIRKRPSFWFYIVLWSFAAALTFAAPYLYIFIFSRELPPSLAWGLGFVVAILLVSAVISLLRRLHHERTR